MRSFGVVLVGSLVAFSSGCGVPERVVEEKNAALVECRFELDRCGTARDDCKLEMGRLEAGIAAWRDRDAKHLAQIEAVGAKAAALGDELTECIRAGRAASETISTLESRERELRQRLQREIANRDVEIERLRDRLSVRILDRILFDTGKAAIRPEGRRVLDKVGPVIAAGDEYARIEAHADKRSQ